MCDKSAGKRVLNVNVGILGHVDSGKTSIVAALSTQLSTAALDKHPQSKQRGITLDLGFSSFALPMPERLAHLPYDELQFTLVDCPGHASLIRTIIGGLQIIDMMVLVVDITKGMQTQTAECLVVGEVATNRLVVALNKIDQLHAGDEREKAVRGAIKRLTQTFTMTKFVDVNIVPVSARPDGKASNLPLGIEDLKAALVAMVPPVPRVVRGHFLFAVDHCFQIKGQGSVLTGTVLQGSISVNEILELPALKAMRIAKSIQMFKTPVQRAVQGDRVGICVTQLDARLLERGLACAPGTVPTFSGAIATVEKIRFYAGRVPSHAKFHVSVGHTTVMAEMTFFGTPDGGGLSRDAALAAMVANLNPMTPSGSPVAFDLDKDYQYQASLLVVVQDELYGLEGRPIRIFAAGWQMPLEAADGGNFGHFGPQWALLKFDKPVTAPKEALIIGAKFDSDVHGEACRLAFYGRLACVIDLTDSDELARLKVYKMKIRTGSIERLQTDGTTAIVRGLLKKNSDVAAFLGLQVRVTSGRGEEGLIIGTFGKSGKLKVHFPGGIATEGRNTEDNTIMLRCKRYLFDPDTKAALRQ
uniref:Selenocysteine-specific elongation factor n=1 Tax=Volvox carteri f. nagariensis TaxID=3068 RepID=D9CJ70_VOLCA|nr:SelEFm [Volvox carteri f. nagariensis]